MIYERIEPEKKLKETKGGNADAYHYERRSDDHDVEKREFLVLVLYVVKKIVSRLVRIILK